MIQIICKSESYTYNAYHILKAFYPSQEVSCKTDEKASNYVTVEFAEDGTDGQKEAMIEIADRQAWKLLTQQVGMKAQGRYRKIQRRRARKKKENGRLI